jgi:hypothetical protein
MRQQPLWSPYARTPARSQEIVNMARSPARKTSSQRSRGNAAARSTNEPVLTNVVADTTLDTWSDFAARVTHIGEAVTRQAAENWSMAAIGLLQLQGAASSTAMQWLALQGRFPVTAEAFEALEAEVEHVTNPLVASPLVWPAQEATRQAMTLATSAWNDWLSWSSHWAEASRAAAGGALRGH